MEEYYEKVQQDNTELARSSCESFRRKIGRTKIVIKGPKERARLNTLLELQSRGEL